MSPGFYEAPLPRGALVHALEHGHVVIYYGALSPEARASLHALTQLFDGRWDGVIAVPRTDRSPEITLTAWRRSLQLPAYNPEAAAAFIAAHRGRGPESPARDAPGGAI